MLAQISGITSLFYIVACVFYIFGIKNLGKPTTAVKGNFLSIVGAVIGVGAALFEGIVVDSWSGAILQNGYFWAFVAFSIGAVIGGVWAKVVEMTGMPELVAIFNGIGGLATAMVAFTEFMDNAVPPDIVFAVAAGLTIFIGTICFTGSMLAWGKLSGKFPGKAILFPGQKPLNGLIIIVAMIGIVIYAIPGLDPVLKWNAMLVMSALAVIFGFTLVLPIGGGDMPCVISLLNSLTGLALAMAGILLTNTLLIVTGCLVGASGVILTVIMAKAMNRSIANILFSGFGATVSAGKGGPKPDPKSCSTEDAYMILESARSVVFIPGYGMAVAQAQHVVKELAARLEENGAEVNFAIHPVAGRMPGHMNVLLAEADVPYEQLKTMDEMNPNMEMQDVAFVIGANDVVNPVAETDPGSPIYGMPIIKAHLAKTCFCLKRGKGAGFSGIDNDLFYIPNTLMIYGDAKATITSLGAEFKAE